MKHRAGEYVPGVVNVLPGITMYYGDTCQPLRGRITPWGAVFHSKAGRDGCRCCRMPFVFWAAAFIKAAFMGEVAPILPVLVSTGPYRVVHHPVYIGMTVALFGVALTLISGAGTIGTLLLFLPSEVYRARLEDKALAQKFGKE
ncbi:MAG: methyltransferase [Bacillota bacterium]